MGECKCKENISHSRRIKITGTKWERPIPKSKEYWEKFCDNEEKKLTVVRNPLLPFSCRSVSEIDSKLVNFNTSFIEHAFNFDSLFNSETDRDETFENSLHGLSCDETVSLPEPVLKAPFRAQTKTPDATGLLSKVVRIPKLDAQDAQPSFGRLFHGKVDRIRDSFGVQNESKTGVESICADFTALPMLDKFPATAGARSTLNKLRRHLRLPERSNFLGKLAASSKHRLENKKTEGLRHTKSEDEKEDQKQPSDRVCLKYSTRFAYKALKHLTCNKKLNFRAEKMEQSCEERLSMLRKDKYTNGNDKLEPLKSKDMEDSEESLYVEDVQGKSLKDSEFTGTNVEDATLKSEQATSKTIPSESRYTSGPSLEFAYPENRKDPSTRLLQSIPRLSGFPRKNRDRCLPCMYRPFETPLKRRISLPRTALQRIISSEYVRITSSSDSSEDSDSTFVDIENFSNETRRMLNLEVECNDVTFVEQHNAVESQVVAEDVSSVEETYQATKETIDAKSITDSGISCKTISKKATIDHGDDDSYLKNLNDVGTKFSASFHSESSEEDDSIVISINDEQAKPKYLVPCHAPTVFRPSLEPLRALRHRKPTTLQDRIALLESSSLKKSISIDDHDDIPEKSKSVSRSTHAEGKPPLTKAKSVLEKLTPAKVETPSKNKQPLRKGASLSNFSITTDPVSAKSEILHDVSKDTRQESNLNTVLDSSESNSKLPLTRFNEIIEVLTNLEKCSSSSMLEILCKEFSERLSKTMKNEDTKVEKKIAKLTRLLVDSKRYLHPDKFPSDLFFSTNQPVCCNPRILRRVLPQKSYNLIAPLLGLPEWHRKRETWFQDTDARRHIDQQPPADETSSKYDTVSSLAVHPPTPRDIESPRDKEKLGQRRYNPYALFLMKPRRKVVTWRPLTERDLEGYDPDATLKMRSDNVMEKIFRDFCQWVESLGGTDKTIDEEVLRDMFEIDFDAEACKAMQISIREMPVVPTPVAITRNSPGASKLAMTRKHVMKDVKAERKPAKIKAFGAGIPWELRFVPPNNQVERNWLRCDRVPKDLETMDAIWKGITGLRSVRGFVERLKQHPEIRPPEALKKIVSMDVITLKQTEDDEAFAHLELDINQIMSFRVVDSIDVSP